MFEEKKESEEGESKKVNAEKGPAKVKDDLEMIGQRINTPIQSTVKRKIGRMQIGGGKGGMGGMGMGGTPIQTTGALFPPPKCKGIGIIRSQSSVNYTDFQTIKPFDPNIQKTDQLNKPDLTKPFIFTQVPKDPKYRNSEIGIKNVNLLLDIPKEPKSASNSLQNSAEKKQSTFFSQAIREKSPNGNNIESEGSEDEKRQTNIPLPQEIDLIRKSFRSSTPDSSKLRINKEGRAKYGNELRLIRKSSGRTQSPKYRKRKEAIQSEYKNILKNELDLMKAEERVKEDIVKKETNPIAQNLNSPDPFAGIKKEMGLKLEKVKISIDLEGGSDSNNSSNDEKDERLRLNSQPHRDHLIQTMQSIPFINNLTLPPMELINTKSLPQLHQPIPQFKGTVVWDLDETLVHCVDNAQDGQIQIDIPLPDGGSVIAGANIRPYAREILHWLLEENFEIMVFTASHQCYGQVMINELENEGKKLFHHALFRNNCVRTEAGLYIKDLRVLNRDLKRTFLIDNATYSFAFQVENGVPIIPYYDDPKDRTLLKIKRYIEKLIKLPNDHDFRTNICETFKLKSLIQSSMSNFINYYLDSSESEGEEETKEGEGGFMLPKPIKASKSSDQLTELQKRSNEKDDGSKESRKNVLKSLNQFQKCFKEDNLKYDEEENFGLVHSKSVMD